MQLKQYPAERIRNVGLFSHGGAGKTSLAEALLFDTGAITRLGRVEEGNTVSDFDPDEVKRHISVSAAILPLEVPIGAESGFAGVVEVLHRRAYRFAGRDGKAEEGAVPDDLAEQVETYRAQLVERIAENDDALIEKFLADEPIEDAELEA